MQIRHAIFETNSSSTHSLVFGGGISFQSINPKDFPNGIRLEGGDYGWGPYEIHRWQDKANYCFTYAIQKADVHLLAMLKKVLNDYTGLDIDFASDGDEYHPCGYIDHQSEDVCGEAYESEEKLKDLIWGIKSYIIIDNDNH